MTPYRLSNSLLALCACLAVLPAWGQKFTTTPNQIQTAQKVAQAGVPLSDLAPNAPDSYIVKRGDTLWAISNIFLKSPWRWPELWGMNLDDLKNPHLIYPGHALVLDKSSGRAILRNANAGDATKTAPATSGSPAASNAPVLNLPATRDDSAPKTVRLSPRVRTQSVVDPLATLNPSAIEPFLAEPLIIEESELALAPRIVAVQENRVMLTRGDRAYARGPAQNPLLDNQSKEQIFRLFGTPKPLRDPVTNEILGFEGQFVGKAALARSEMLRETASSDKPTTEIVPATIDIIEAVDPILVGYLMQPEPERQFFNYVPRAPSKAVDGRVISIYGTTSLVNASQNQVVVINLGRRNGIESGHVLTILKNGERSILNSSDDVVDKTDPNRPLIKFPNERNGLMMVFKTFEKLSYGIVLEITEGVRIGDRLGTP